MQPNCGIQQWIQMHRTLLQINLDNAMEADAVFEQLMGEEVEPRRRFIEENAVYVKNLDI